MPRIFAWTSNELLIWINSDKGYNGIAEAGQRFTEDTGIRVIVEHPEGAPDKFFHAARSGQGPDIMIWAHDRLGEWANAGLLLPIHPTPAFTNRVFPKAWEAFRHDGKVWGYPISMESTALIYNLDILSSPPRNLNEVEALSKELPAGVYPLLWDYGNTYFTWGLIAAGGGYVFGQDDEGHYDVTDIGINSPGAVNAMEAVYRLVEKGVVPKSLSYSVAEAAMNQGKAAMFISGPFAWSDLQKNGIRFGITTIPGMEGNPGRPFVGVLGAIFNRASPNLDLAQEFLEHYLITVDGLAAMNRHVPLGVPALKEYYEQLSADPLIAGSMENIEVGVLMPNIPEMGAFWSDMKTALSIIMSGRATPQDALDGARNRMIRK